VSHRSIAQERLSLAPTSRSSSTLERLSDLIDWIQVACLSEPPYPASKGDPAWPPLAMSKALLLAV
jgi:IS5 family transposase